MIGIEKVVIQKRASTILGLIFPSRCAKMMSIRLLSSNFGSIYGVIAQLIRALPLQGRGPGFESLLLHHFYAKIWGYSSAG